MVPTCPTTEVPGHIALPMARISRESRSPAESAPYQVPGISRAAAP
jgi:hypothetical protein